MWLLAGAGSQAPAVHLQVDEPDDRPPGARVEPLHAHGRGASEVRTRLELHGRMAAHHTTVAARTHGSGEQWKNPGANCAIPPHVFCRTPVEPTEPVLDRGIPRKVVYVPSCVTRMMGPAANDDQQVCDPGGSACTRGRGDGTRALVSRVA